MFQAPSRSSRSRAPGERGRVVEHALELVAHGAVEGEEGRHVVQHLQRGRYLVGAAPTVVLVDGEDEDVHVGSSLKVLQFRQ